MKKSLVLLTIGILFGAAAGFATSKVFSDIPLDAWYSSAVLDLHQKGIVSGYKDGTFRPEAGLNRAEASVMLEKLIEYMNAHPVHTALSVADAQALAEKSACIQEGNLNGTAGYYNPNSSTWWFDMNTQKTGCSPACVVDAKTQTASINWRCTGAL